MKKYLLLGVTYVLYPIFLFGDCDSGYVEILDISESVTVLDSSNCFYQSDVDFLQDFIDLNESLSGEPLEIGIQEWNGGRLTLLILSYNELTSLPESIGNLSSLETLYLNHNELTSLPESIGNLSSLETLYLNSNSNQLTTLPESIGNLSSLDWLSLGSNQLTTLPESIGNLSSLKNLDLYNNQLTTLPESIGSLSSLEELSLISNQLTSLPESICNIPGTCYISVENNQLCEEYHYECIDSWGEQDCDCDSGYVEIEYFCYWEEDYQVLQDFIDLNESLSGEPLEIGNQEWNGGRLTNLSLTTYQLTSLPESIGSLSSLEELWLHNNQLTLLPESIGNLRSLDNLSLSNNQLTSIPESIGNLSSLDWLSLPSNQLTSIPESIGNLSSLDLLYLHDNQLMSLPESIGNLSSLGSLYLSSNQLTSLPESICNIPISCYIIVDNNQLCEEYHYDCIDDWGEQDCLSISEPTIPITYNLSSPYPNPFNPTTTVQFSIPQSDLVSIKVYDIHGREVTTLVNDYLHTGYHTISWNGYKSTSGIYFIRMEGGEFVQTRKVMLLK